MKNEVLVAIITLVLGAAMTGLAFAGKVYIERQAAEQVQQGISTFQESEVIRHLDYYNTKEQFAPLTADDRANKKSYEMQLERLRSVR